MMINMLSWIEEISASRDRDFVAATMVKVVFGLIKPGMTMSFRVINTSEGPRLFPLYRCTIDGVQEISERELADFHETNTQLTIADGILLQNVPLLAKAFNSGMMVIEPRQKGIALIWPVKQREASIPNAMVVAEIDHSPDIDQLEVVTLFLQFCGNYVGLLDYSELDSLTGLNNRKTYDETFERLISSIPVMTKLPEGQERRNEVVAEESFWMGEVDIDHFKRINDTFGHLFGDEVLLRLANLMRKSFRATDCLYRFGGEEFVVILRSTTKKNAERVFERFRTTVEKHEFPQVGQVTCSIGYTRVLKSMLATDILGQADEALYFSKENGRNQVNCYNELIEQGLLTPKSVGGGQIDADIDALFG